MILETVGEIVAPTVSSEVESWRGKDKASSTSLRRPDVHDIMVSMTRKLEPTENVRGQVVDRRWRLQDAKARLSELVRMAHRDGPQHVTLHGRDSVVIVDADEFQRLKGARTGQLLVEALRLSPHREIDIAAPRSEMPVRAIEL